MSIFTMNVLTKSTYPPYVTSLGYRHFLIVVVVLELRVSFLQVAARLRELQRDPALRTGFFAELPRVYALEAFVGLPNRKLYCARCVALVYFVRHEQLDFADPHFLVENECELMRLRSFALPVQVSVFANELADAVARLTRTKCTTWHAGRSPPAAAGTARPAPRTSSGSRAVTAQRRVTRRFLLVLAVVNHRRRWACN